MRPSVKEQVESLGAKFIDVPYETDEERERPGCGAQPRCLRVEAHEPRIRRGLARQ